MAGGAEMEAALVDFDAVQDLDILRGVFDQGEIESLVGNRFTADQGARGGTRLGVTLKNAVQIRSRRRCRRQISCITLTSGRPAR